jgi:hypothetical protein
MERENRPASLGMTVLWRCVETAKEEETVRDIRAEDVVLNRTWNKKEPLDKPAATLGAAWRNTLRA